MQENRQRSRDPVANTEFADLDFAGCAISSGVRKLAAGVDLHVELPTCPDHDVGVEPFADFA